MPLPDLASRLTAHAERLFNRVEEAARLAANEAELRRHIEPYIEDALTELYGLSFQQIRSERRNASGQYDVAYGGVVVEFEYQMSRARRRHGAQQALDYLGAERERLGHDNMFSAVVLDGRQWGFLVSDEEVAAVLEIFGAPVQAPDEHFVWRPNSVAACRRLLELVGSNRQTPVTGDSLVSSFGRGSSIARESISRFVEAVHNRTPGDRTTTMYGEWRRALEVAYGALDDTNTQALRAIRQEYGIGVAGSLGEFLFALHTYFALVARLVAAEVLSISVGEAESRPSQWSSLSDSQFREMMNRLEHGTVPHSLSISNLFEGDVFSWYLDRLQGTVSFVDALRGICAELARFAFPRLAYGSAPTADLLRDLYQGLTTRALRKALGEFLTPNWLAQATLEAARRNGADLIDDRALDCTCGTGTFLRPMLAARLQKLRRSDGAVTASEVQTVLNSVVGIDINPVAVVAARMNYLMSLGDLATVGNLYLPVWLADAVLLPSRPEVQTELMARPVLAGRQFVELHTSLEEPFVIPVELLTQDAIARLANLLREFISPVAAGVALSNAQIEDRAQQFVTRASSVLGPTAPEPVVPDEAGWDNAGTVLAFLFRQILALHVDGRDEVWAEIIQNRFAPLFLDKFDLVVGNPPWLSWKWLPTQWKERAEPLWRDYGLFRVPDVPGVDRLQSLQSSDIAVLVTAVALERYLRLGGTLAFVTPKGLLNGDAANRAFRLYELSSQREPQARRPIQLPFRVLEIVDFSEVRPFSPDAANSPVVLVLRSGEPTQFPVPGRRWFRRKGAILPDVPWEILRQSALLSESVSWLPISSYGASPLAWWRPDETPLRRSPSTYTFGMGFNTRGAAGVFHIELRGTPSVATNLVRIANLPKSGDKEVEQHIGEVNARLVIPVVRGQDIKPFSIEPDGYVLLAHDPTDRSRALTPAEMRSTVYVSTLNFLSNFRDTLIERPPYKRFRPTENQWWHVGNCEQLGADGTLVCVQEIAEQPAAAVLRAIWDERLGRTILPIPNHKVVFFRTSVEDEAYYLSGMINSKAAQTLLARFANTTAISPQTIRYLPIPPFAAGDALQLRIAQLSRDIHGVLASERALMLQDLNAAVEDLIAREQASLPPPSASQDR